MSSRHLTGDERPKQLCPVLGDETLLEQTWRRMLRVVAPGASVAVIPSDHHFFDDARLMDRVAFLRERILSGEI